MVLPRLERMAQLTGDPALLRDPVAVAELREDYRYMASVCRTILPNLEAELSELPEELAPGAPVEARVAFQMGLIKRTNRLYRAVSAYVANPAEVRLAALG